MANFKGKRMVKEDLIKKLEELEPGGGYTAGSGISIEDGVLSVDYGTGITVDDGTLVVDTDVVAVKSDIVDITPNSTATPSATLTNLQVGSITYEVPQGGGSVDIDNQTIIEDPITGKIKTAVGGYVGTYAGETDFTLPGTSADWDLTISSADNDITRLFNILQANVQYPVTVTLANGASLPFTLQEAYVLATSKTATKFGGDNTLHLIDSNNTDHKLQFYIDISSNKGKMHIYPSSSGVSAVNGSTFEIDFGDVEEISTIDEKFIPTLFTEGAGIDITSGVISADISATTPVRIDTTGTQKWINLDYDKTQFSNRIYSGSSFTSGVYSFLEHGYLPMPIPNSDLVANETYSGWYDIINPSRDRLFNIALNFKKRNPNFTYLSLYFQEYKSDGTKNGGARHFNYSITYSESDNVATVSVNGTYLIFGFTCNITTGEILTVTECRYKRSNTSFYSLDITPYDGYNYDLLPDYKQINKKWIPLVSDIPAAPTTQGAYKLRCTVDANGVPTYTWEADV